MRRFVYAALIGGFIGFALLLNLAAEKAGCWGFQNLAFPNVILLPVTEHKISHLITSARVLIFRKELLDSGFEYFVRGAGFAVLFLLFVETTIKRLKRLPSIKPFTDWCDVSGYPTYLDRRNLARFLLAVCIPVAVLLMLTCLIPLRTFVFENCLDATSIAILAPSLALIILLTAAAYRKRLFVWQMAQSPNGIVRFVLFCFQLVAIVFSFSLACALTQAFPQTSSDSFRSAIQNNMAPASLLFTRTMCEVSAIALDCALYAAITLFLLQAVAYKFVTRKSLELIVLSSSFSSCAFCWGLFYISPFIHMFVMNQPMEGGFDRLLARDVYRLCVALSTLPCSLAGIAVAMFPSQRTVESDEEVEQLSCVFQGKLVAYEKMPSGP